MCKASKFQMESLLNFDNEYKTVFMLLSYDTKQILKIKIKIKNVTKIVRANAETMFAVETAYKQMSGSKTWYLPELMLLLPLWWLSSLRKKSGSKQWKYSTNG